MHLSIFAAAREAPNRIGLVTEKGCFTYSELAVLTAGRAATLVDFRDPLLLQPQLDLDSLLWLYAAFATGTPFLPLHPEAPAQERAAVEARTGARNPPNRDVEAASARNPPNRDVEAASRILERDVDPESPISLMLTSGSTGTPKVVVLSRRAVLASASASERNLGVDAEERWLLCLSLSHVAGLSIIVRMLAARRTVVLF
jgi:O-succinylbenzoic acid--CoA ligase